MPKNNLQPKMVMDFTKEDTIYIKSPKHGNHDGVLYLCQFDRYEGSRVYGKKIEATVNESLHSREQGEEMSAPITMCALFGENPTSGHAHYHWFMNNGYAIYPSDYNKDSVNANVIKQHPAFGMIQLSRRTSRGTTLFGSSIQHNELMSITICQGEVDRHLNNDWYHAKRELIEVELSASQFADFITSPNQGSGIPCTIRHIEHTRIPEPPFESRKDLFSNEFEKAMKNITHDLKGNMANLKLILAKPTAINKKDKEDIYRLFESFTSMIGSSIPFMEKQFAEQMDKTVTEAKAEIEAFVTRRITEEGKKVLMGGENGELKMITNL